jgi:hypothetical protein
MQVTVHQGHRAIQAEHLEKPMVPQASLLRRRSNQASMPATREKMAMVLQCERQNYVHSQFDGKRGNAGHAGGATDMQ